MLFLPSVIEWSDPLNHRVAFGNVMAPSITQTTMTAANEYVTIGLIFGIICLLCNLYADQTNKKVKREKSWFLLGKVKWYRNIYYYMRQNEEKSLKRSSGWYNEFRDM